jgi:hypothetical protein
MQLTPFKHENKNYADNLGSTASFRLSAVGSLAFRAVYDAIYFGGLTAVSHKAASAYVGNVLFGGGIFFTTILFQFLNPFF